MKCGDHHYHEEVLLALAKIEAVLERRLVDREDISC
jgi:hypothetical protein